MQQSSVHDEVVDSVVDFVVVEEVTGGNFVVGRVVISNDVVIGGAFVVERAVSGDDVVIGGAFVVVIGGAMVVVIRGTFAVEVIFGSVVAGEGIVIGAVFGSVVTGEGVVRGAVFGSVVNGEGVVGGAVVLHGSMLQAIDSSKGRQGAPQVLFLTTMVRVRFLVPPPQGAVQGDQADQAESSQSIQQFKLQPASSTSSGQGFPPQLEFVVIIRVRLRVPLQD